MSKVGFIFPIETSQQWEGFNDSGIETFSGSPFRSFGREATQNSMDAALSSSKPVKCSVKVRSVNVAEIPGVDDLRATVALCQPGADKNEKASDFFNLATELLGKKKISILQYEDSNTTGVSGPCENGTPYFALVKAKGQSVKPDGMATGSYGIGKFAPFTLSRLRTIFITTVWEDEDGNLQHYVQGKSILMSHMNNGKTHRGTGFWGVEEQCQPIIGLSDEIPIWLRREKKGEPIVGTTVTILGFDEQKEHWEYIIGAGIAESFFSAIQTKKLSVAISDKVKLNPETLTDFFSNQDAIDAISVQEGQPQDFLRSGDFLEVLSDSSDVKTEDHQNTIFGHMKLKIIVRENLPKRVAVTRNGMLITSRLERLKNLGEFKGFAAVLECKSEVGNKLLRDMEPPAHDAFEPQRLQDPKRQRVARRELMNIAGWVRKMLKRHAQNEVSEITAIDELSEFFSDDDEDGNNGGRSDKFEGENPRGIIKIRARPLPVRKVTSYLPPSSTGGEEDGGSADPGAVPGSGTTTGNGSSPGGGSGGDKKNPGSGDTKPAQRPFEIANLRAIPLGSNRRRISFTPIAGGMVRIKLAESGADFDRDLSISSAADGNVENGELLIECAARNRVSIEVELSHDFDGAIKVTADAV